MAQAHTAPNGFDSPAVASKNLARLLSRLDQKLRSGKTPTLLERAKIAANLEYSRQLLHNLESASANITVPTRRQKSLAELGAQKQTIRRLNESLQLASAAEGEGEDEGEGEGEEEGRVLVNGGDTATATATAAAGDVNDDDDDYALLKKPKGARRRPTAATPVETPAKPDVQQQQAEPESTLRQRLSTKTPLEQRQELFGASASGAKKATHTAVPEVASTEALLDYQRSEQETITADLLQMAKMLKESSLEFGRNLEDEKGYLEAAREGLDHNTQGMQVAGLRMDRLRKDENVSFIWSMLYLAIIVALAFLTLFILFFAPKLRWW